MDRFEFCRAYAVVVKIASPSLLINCWMYCSRRGLLLLPLRGYRPAYLIVALTVFARLKLDEAPGTVAALQSLREHIASRSASQFSSHNMGRIMIPSFDAPGID